MSKKNYRPNVAAIIVSPKYPSVCEFFLAQRSDMKGIWQFPQGGIDKGESPKEALFRELKEEIGTDNIEVLAECPKWIAYDFPKAVSKKFYPFDGQKQKYFLVRLKKESEINIHTQHPEFNAFKFVSFDEILDIANHFKKNVYREVLEYFRKEGYI